MQRTGFTLVELSIVLVIIGVIIGGLVAAKSMMATAKVTDRIRKLGQYEIAIGNFKNTFKQEPGDSNLFYPPGNNNRTNAEGSPDIDFTCFADYIGWEYINSWAQLSASGTLSKKYRAWFPKICPGGTDSNDEFDSNDTVQPYFSDVIGLKTAIQYHVQTVTLSGAGTAIRRGYSAFLLPTDTFSIEKKLDDGNIATGKMRSASCAITDSFCAVSYFPDYPE